MSENTNQGVNLIFEFSPNLKSETNPSAKPGVTGELRLFNWLLMIGVLVERSIKGPFQPAVFCILNSEATYWNLKPKWIDSPSTPPPQLCCENEFLLTKTESKMITNNRFLICCPCKWNKSQTLMAAIWYFESQLYSIIL